MNFFRLSSNAPDCDSMSCVPRLRFLKLRSFRSGGPQVSSPGREAWVSDDKTTVGPKDRQSVA